MSGRTFAACQRVPPQPSTGRCRDDWGSRPWPTTQLDTVWWTFPNDRRLRGLGSLLRPPRPPPSAVCLGCSRWCRVAAERAPERSVTLDAHDQARRLRQGVWLATRDVAAQYEHVATTFGARGHSHAPSPRVGEADRSGTRGDAGQQLDDRPRSNRSGPCTGWGRSPRARRRPPPDAVRSIATAWNGCSTARSSSLGPPGRRRGRPSSPGRAGRRPADREPVLLLHGDCHPKNALVTPDPSLDRPRPGRRGRRRGRHRQPARLHDGGEPDAPATSAEARGRLPRGLRRFAPLPPRPLSAGTPRLRWWLNGPSGR